MPVSAWTSNDALGPAGLQEPQHDVDPEAEARQAGLDREVATDRS